MCGKEGRIDCTKQFGRKWCDPSSDKFEKCVPKGKECDVYSTADSCEGNKLVYCDDGYKEKSDCAALGFSRCEPWKVGSTAIGALCK